MSGCDECSCDGGEWRRAQGYLILPSDVAFTALGFAARVLRAASKAALELQEATGRHINYRRNREDFAIGAGLEIETLTSPPKEES